MTNTTATALEVTTARLDVLRAAIRYAGWKPADLRANASTLDDGCNIASPYLTADVAAATAANMRAEADRIEAAAEAAQTELDRRAAKARPARIGYVA